MSPFSFTLKWQKIWIVVHINFNQITAPILAAANPERGRRIAGQDRHPLALKRMPNGRRENEYLCHATHLSHQPHLLGDVRVPRSISISIPIVVAVHPVAICVEVLKPHIDIVHDDPCNWSIDSPQ